MQQQRERPVQKRNRETGGRTRQRQLQIQRKLGERHTGVADGFSDCLPVSFCVASLPSSQDQPSHLIPFWMGSSG